MVQQEKTREYLTIQDVQKKLKLGKNATYSFIKLNGIQKIKIGRKTLIPSDLLDKYLNDHINTTIFLR